MPDNTQSKQNTPDLPDEIWLDPENCSYYTGPNRINGQTTFIKYVRAAEAVGGEVREYPCSCGKVFRQFIAAQPSNGAGLEIVDRLQSVLDTVAMPDCRVPVDGMLRKIRAELFRQQTAQPLPDHDNHHNALKCPYCNPKDNLVELPEGWKLVPIEPTLRMIQSARSIFGERMSAAQTYQAMLSAAPKKGGE